MKSNSPIVPSKILTCALLLWVVCLVSCGRACKKAGPGAGESETKSEQVANPDTTDPAPGPTEEGIDDSVTTSQIIAARIRSSVRQLAFTVFRIRGGSRRLTPDRSYPLQTGDRIKTNDSGTAEVNIANCMTIYVFELSGLTMSTCPGFARGNAVCSSSGTSLFNNRCGSHIRKVETDTAEIKLEGTYFRVAYWPEKRRTIIDVHEGPVEVRPVLDAKGKFDGPVKIREGCWCAPSDQCFVAGVPSDQPQPCTKLTPENAAYLARTTKQTAERIVLDHTPIAPGPTIEVLAPNPNGVAPNDLIDFGQVEIGSQATRSLTVTNISSLPLKFQSISVIDRIHYFGIDNDSCTSQLEMGKKCKIDLTFKPADFGSYTGSLRIADNAKWSPRHVSLKGIAIYPWAETTSIDPLALQFEQQTVGTISSSQHVHVSKTTPIAPPMFEGPAKNDFKVVSNNCVDESRSCEIEVAFAPADFGNRDATLVISPLKTSASATPPRKVVALHGVSTTKAPDPSTLTPIIEISTKDVCFNAHKVVDPKSVRVRKSEIVPVTNAGKGPLLISSIVPLKKDIIVESQNCMGRPVTEECNITVGFTPTGTGMRYAKLRITSNDPHNPTMNVRFAGRGKSRNWFIRGFHWVFRINQGDECEF